MRHAGPAALDRLEPLLNRLRRFETLREKSRGTFYLKSRAFLHFHDDPSGLFADVRLVGDRFERLRVTEAVEQEDLIRAVAAHLNR